MNIRFGVLTVSDRSAKGERSDRSGVELTNVVKTNGWEVHQQAIVADEIDEIQKKLIAWCDSSTVDVILTTGGTGFSIRDVTPEASLGVIERLAPGLAEAMRRTGSNSTPHAMLSRAVSGIRGRTLIVNLPGSPTGAVESLEVILPVLEHAVQLLNDDPGSESTHRF
jgi:molybdenum cofactor synthesis domain-containing protein